MTRRDRWFLALSVVVALLMFLAAAGSGSDADGGLPSWVDVAANVVAATVGIMVLVPRTRALGGLLAAINWTGSAVVNLLVDGFDYSITLLPLNVIATVAGIAVYRHYRTPTRATEAAAR